MKLKQYIHPLPDHRQESVSAYFAGFAFSLTLTVAGFLVVWAYLASNGQLVARGVLIALLTVLAVAQILVQVVFFLHLSAERKLRMSLLASVFTVFAVLCLVVGSLWVMNNLNYNMMPAHSTEYTEVKEGIYRQTNHDRHMDR
jgi:cytochrome o ubiquinol oxidase operon protein cyoD